MRSLARLVPAALITLTAAPALADTEVVHTEQLVVVTPNPPVVVSSGAASAAPGAFVPAQSSPGQVAPAAALAPQNEDWNEVSHINGTPVKVGERGDYLLRHPKTNIASNPIGWMFGFYGLSVSHAVHPNAAVRLDANIISFDNQRGHELGASLPIYFRRVYSGPFIEPGVITRGSRYDTYDGYDVYEETMVGPEMMFGWHWTFDSGLNVAAAVGAARNLDRSNDYYGDDVVPAGYFRVGYAM